VWAAQAPARKRAGRRNVSKRKKPSRAWLARHIDDPYVKLAQKHGYRSRAAFKLIEIDAQDRLIRPGIVAVDLGSAPGAWSQVLRERLARPGGAGIDGRIVALDLLPMEPIPDVTFLQGDFREEETLRRLEAALGGAKPDLVVSDMAPNLSGIASADAARMSDLIELAVAFALAHLKPDGALLVKCFHGSGYSQAVELFKRSFARVAVRKPKASRAGSAETYLLGRSPKKINDLAIPPARARAGNTRRMQAVEAGNRTGKAPEGAGE
jgi:23S rRNA (uridine2552-2'-O)-methyltransferase